MWRWAGLLLVIACNGGGKEASDGADAGDADTDTDTDADGSPRWALRAVLSRLRR